MTDKPFNLEELVHGLPVAVIVVARDDDYTLRFANAETARLIGYDIDDFLNSKKYAAATAVHPDDLDLLAQADEIQSRTRKTLITRYRLVAADGSIVPVLDVSRPLLDGGDEIVSFMTVLVDLREAPELQGPSRILSGQA